MAKQKTLHVEELISTSQDTSKRIGEGQFYHLMWLSKFLLCLVVAYCCYSAHAFVLPLRRAPTLARATETSFIENNALCSTSPNRVPFFLAQSTSGNEVIDNISSQSISLEFSTQVSDGIRVVVFVVVALLLVVAALSTFVTQSVLPQQMENLSQLVADENPTAFGEIVAKLEDGQNLKDRPDLMSELVEIGVDLMKKEDDDEMENVLQMVKDKKKKNDDDDNDDKLDIESLREPLEAAVGMTIEEFIDLVDKNPNSKYMTDTKRELAQIFKEEIK